MGVAEAYIAEAIIYDIVVFTHIVCVFNQLGFRYRKGHRPSRISKGPIFGASMATLFEVVRAIDPSGAFGILRANTLSILSIYIAAFVLMIGAWVIYHVIKDIYYAAVKRSSTYKSKGIARIGRTAKWSSISGFCVATAISICLIVDNNKRYLGFWLIWMCICALALLLELSYGGRWLRRRLRRHFRKTLSGTKLHLAVIEHTNRLTFFRYSFIAIAVCGIIGCLLVSLYLVFDNEKVNEADANSYNFENSIPMFFELMVISMFFWFGWIPKSSNQEILASSKSLPALSPKERDQMEEDLHLEQMKKMASSSQNMQQELIAEEKQNDQDIKLDIKQDAEEKTNDQDS